MTSGPAKFQVTPGWIDLRLNDNTFQIIGGQGNERIALNSKFVAINSDLISLNGEIKTSGNHVLDLKGKQVKIDGLTEVTSGPAKIQVTPGWIDLRLNVNIFQIIGGQGNERIALNSGFVAVNSDLISLNGEIKTSLTGVGNAYACLNSNGELYRSDRPCS